MMVDTRNVETGFVEVEGVRLAYQRAGDGPDLVLVHAGLADSGMWDEQFSMLATRFRVLRYDMRGFGRSSMPPGLFSHHTDLAQLVGALGIQQAHYIGCSMGAKVVIDLAVEEPDRFISMVLVSPAISGFQFSGTFPQPFFDLITARQAGDIEKAADLQVQIWIDGFRRTSRQADALLRQRVYQMSLDALTAQAGYLRETGFVPEQPLEPTALERLDHLTMPILIITGELDEDITLASAEVLAKRVDSAQTKEIPGTTHLPNMEKPDEFNQLVLDFLERSRL